MEVFFLIATQHFIIYGGEKISSLTVKNYRLKVLIKMNTISILNIG